MQSKFRALLVALAIAGLILPAFRTSASNGTVNVGFADIPNNGCYTFWGQQIQTKASASYAGLTMFLDHINFTNALWGGNGFTNSPQSFGLACSSGNVTLQQINSDRVFLYCTFTGSSCSVFFYYLQSPTEVDLAPSTQIFPNQFTTSTTNYANSNSPIVYQNQASNYLEIKTFSSAQLLTVFYSTPGTSNSSGGSGVSNGYGGNGSTPQSSTSGSAYATTCTNIVQTSLGANGVTQTYSTRYCPISANTIPPRIGGNGMINGSTTIGPVSISNNPVTQAIVLILIIVVIVLIVGIIRRPKGQPATVDLGRVGV